MIPIGPAARGVIVAATAPVELAVGALVVAAAGFKTIDWEFVMFGFATGATPGGITFTLTNGGLELAHVRAWPLVSKNLSMTIALRS